MADDRRIIFHGYIFAAKLVINLYTIYFDLPIPKFCFKKITYFFILDVSVLIFYGITILIYYLFIIDKGNIFIRMLQILRVRIFWLDAGDRPIDNLDARLTVNDVHSHRLAGVCSVDGDGKGVSVVCMHCRRAIIEMLIAHFQLICVVDGELAIVPCGLSDGELTVFTGGGLVVDNRDTIIGTDRHGRTTNGHRTSLAVHVHHQLARVGLTGAMYQTVFVDFQIRMDALIDDGRDDLCIHRHRASGRIAIGICHRDVELIAVIHAVRNIIAISSVDDLVATVPSTDDLQIAVLSVRSGKRICSVSLMGDDEDIFLLSDHHRNRGRFSGQRDDVRTNRELFQRNLDGIRSIVDRFEGGDLQYRRIIQGIGRNRTCGGSPIRRDGDSKRIRQVGVPSPVILIATIYGGVKRVGVVDLDRAIRRYG